MALHQPVDSKTENLSQVYRNLLERTARAIGADVLVYHSFDLPDARIAVQWGFQLPANFKTTGRLKGRICHHEFVLSGKTTALYPDLSKTPFWESDPDIKGNRWYSYLAAAVKVGDHVVGSLAAFAKQPQRFCQDQSAAVEMGAALIALLDDQSALRAHLAAHEWRQRLMADICGEVDRGAALSGCLSRCLRIIGESYRCDAVSMYHWTEPPGQLQPAAQWAMENRRSAPLDAHIGSLATKGAVAEHLRNHRFFCCDDYRKVPDRRLKKILRELQTSSLVLLSLDTAPARRILFAMQTAGLPCQWDREDIMILMTILRVIGNRLEAHAAARRLDEIQDLNSQIVELSPTAIYSIDFLKRRFISVNEHMCQATGYSREELAAMDPTELLTIESQRLFQQRMLDMASGRPVSKDFEFQLRTKSGKVEWGHFHIRHLYSNGRIYGANVVAHIITEQKRAREELARYGRQLEALVEARTSELSQSNRELRKEIDRHTQTAAELRKQSERLTEMNTAMRVLLDKRNEERIRTEENIRLTLKELIEPYLQRLENSGLARNQRQMIELIRMNLEEVVGSSLPEISSAFLYFSPSELQIVNLIRKGKSTKEMAILLNISPRTVEAYRNNVRKKLGLKNRKVNLRTYLSSFR